MSKDHDTASILTERQLEVLRLRGKGLSQRKIAEILGTTRSNVSILESRAAQNVERARRTIDEWMTIQAPIIVTVAGGSDIFQIPGLIFQEADRLNLRLPMDSVELVVQLRTKAPQELKGRMILRDIQIFVSREGEMLVKPLP
ncbi:MAG: Tfx family DNA-binding protein [Methanotrichaceae archaeon]|nr:Tfx family DNA-binding protein [Methanotrichaceae archaeon]